MAGQPSARRSRPGVQLAGLLHKLAGLQGAYYGKWWAKWHSTHYLVSHREQKSSTTAGLEWAGARVSPVSLCYAKLRSPPFTLSSKCVSRMPLCHRATEPTAT